MTIERRLEQRWRKITNIERRLKRSWFLSAANFINDVPIDFMTMSPALEAKELKTLATAALRFTQTINGLDQDFLQHRQLITTAFRAELASLGQVDRGLPRRFEGSGGRPRSDRMAKSMAAGDIFEMLIDLDIEPMTTKGGDWAKLTRHLFYIATGRECKNPQAICIAYKKWRGPRCSG
jgi:hypothetical protein